MRLCGFIVWLCLVASGAIAQPGKTKNIILVTLDGFRWQELFDGADSTLIHNSEIVRDKTVTNQFWSPLMEDRRQKLMPFFWSTILAHGQLYGNRHYHNEVNCANLQWCSYPGYNELLTGFTDSRIHANKKVDNPNSSVFEFINGQPGFESRVAVFSTWDVFPYILREKESGIPVNAGTEQMKGQLSATEILLNDLQQLIPSAVTNRNDVFTFFFAFEFLKRARPRVLYIGLDETDAYAHNGKYDEYLKTAHRADQMLSMLWEWIQADPDYKDQTTLFITTDHGRGKGRGDGRMSWRNHGFPSFSSGQTWIAVLGPDTPNLGEMKEKMKVYQKQVAATLAASLGMTYVNRREVGSVIATAIRPLPDDGERVPEISSREK